MTMRWLVKAGTITALTLASASSAPAQDLDDGGAITARVHGTFPDKYAGLGVLSGDMFVAGFEVRNGTLTAIGTIVGALADSTGDVLGHVRQDLALPVANVASTCNQLRMDLAATDAEVLKTMVHFDAQLAGFDSRDDAIPKALGVLCDAGQMLRAKPSAAALAETLNGVVAAIRQKKDK